MKTLITLLQDTACNNLSYLGAFVGGILSFLSPCILPLIPSYVSYITGISFEDFKAGDKAQAKHIRLVTLINSSAFILGFSTVFILLGMFSSFLGKYLAVYSDQIRIVGGVIVIFFGLYVMGVIKLNFLSADHRVHLKHKPRGYIGSFIVGLTFGAGWTPCIGPMLGTILLVAGTSGSVMYGFKLLLVYSIGLAIPFLATSLTMSAFISHFSGIQKYMRVIMILSGLLLISFGLFLLSDKVYLLLGAAPDFGLDCP